MKVSDACSNSFATKIVQGILFKNVRKAHQHQLSRRERQCASGRAQWRQEQFSCRDHTFGVAMHQMRSVWAQTWSMRDQKRRFNHKKLPQTLTWRLWPPVRLESLLWRFSKRTKRQWNQQQPKKHEQEAQRSELGIRGIFACMGSKTLPTYQLILGGSELLILIDRFNVDDRHV